MRSTIARKLFALGMSFMSLGFIFTSVWIARHQQRVTLAACLWLLLAICVAFVADVIFNLERRKG